MLVDAGLMTHWAAERLLTASVQGAVVIALVWLACRHVPRIPASVQAVLWWLAALKLVLALVPIPALSLPLLPAGAPVHADLAAVDSATPDEARATYAPDADGSRGSTAAAAEPRAGGWLAAVGAVWFAALVVQAGLLLGAFRRLRALVGRSMPASDDDTALVAELARIVGLRRVPEVRASDEIDAPQVAGLRRPVVLVPAAAGAALTAEDRGMALCHELMHVRRRDLALGWVPALAERLFFFHPLARVAAREYVTTREAACDAAVVRALGVSPEAYGRLLVRLGVAGSEPAFAAGGASRSMSSLRRRLEMLQHSSSARVSRRVWWSIATAVIVAMMPFQVVARTPPSQPTITPAIEHTAARLAQLPLPAAAPARQAQSESAPKPADNDARAREKAEAEKRAMDESVRELKERFAAQERELDAAAEALSRRRRDAEIADRETLRAQSEALRRAVAEIDQRGGVREQIEERASQQRAAFLEQQLAQLTRQQQILIEQIETIAAQQAKLAEAQRQLSAQAEIIRDIIERERQGSQRNAR